MPFSVLARFSEPANANDRFLGYAGGRIAFFGTDFCDSYADGRIGFFGVDFCDSCADGRRTFFAIEFCSLYANGRIDDLKCE